MNEQSSQNFGNNIKEQRKLLRKSQSDLAREANISVSQLSEYENNRKVPGTYTLMKIAKALEISVDELCYGPLARRPIKTAKSEAELIVNCVATLAERDIIGEMSFPCYDHRRESEYFVMLTFCKYEALIKTLCGDIQGFKAKSADYPNPELVKKNILAAASKELERAAAEESFDQEELPF